MEKKREGELLSYNRGLRSWSSERTKQGAHTLYCILLVVVGSQGVVFLGSKMSFSAGLLLFEHSKRNAMRSHL